MNFSQGEKVWSTFSKSEFIKHFKNYISEEKAYTTKKELAYFGLPYYNTQKNILEFNLDKFEDYLQKQKINLPRVDLVIKCQNILKAKIRSLNNFLLGLFFDTTLNIFLLKFWLSEFCKIKLLDSVFKTIWLESCFDYFW